MLVDEPPVSGMTPGRGLLIGAAVLTIVVGFGLGFGLAGSRSGDRVGLVAGPVATSTSTTTTAVVPSSASTSQAPTTAAATTTSVAPSTTSTVVATTAAPTTAPVVVPTTPRSTPPPTQGPPTTFAPPKVVVTYAADAQGRLVIPRKGTATLTITNQGGLASQWLVTGSGFSNAGGPSQGTVGPGQSQIFVAGPPPGELPKGEISGVISVLGAVNSSIRFVIPAA